MTRIAEKFKVLKAGNEKALVPFFCAGDPDLITTHDLVLALEQAGADIIELGIPYTDPLADGPVIQAAAARALKNDITIVDILDLVKRLRETTQIPIVFLLYFNCILQYGTERFLKECAASGVDGLVIPDLPYEEKLQYNALFFEYDIDIIPLVTPVSKARMQKIVKDSTGFIYCVTSTGTTGIRDRFSTDLKRFLDEVKQYSDTPRLLGFGISSPEQVKALKNYGEGVIVGSAVVKKMDTDAPKTKMIRTVADFISELKQALR